MNLDDINHIAVIGAGAMGHSIAEVALLSGFSVSLYDITSEFVETGKSLIDWSLKKFIEKDKISESDYFKFMDNLTITTDLKDACKKADFCIEAAPEKMDLKKKIFNELDKCTPPHAILASNTSFMSITQIAAATQRPKKVIGMHFFNPPVLLTIIEIVTGETTSEETLKVMIEFTKKCNKKPIFSKDSPGFICNRISAPAFLLTHLMLDRKEYSPAKVDAAAMNMGMRMGPYELQDFLGLDIAYDGMKYLTQYFSKDYTPTATLENLMRAKKYGKKTGEGIYKWPEIGRPQIDMSDPADFDVIDMIRVQINEAAKVLEEEIGTPEDINTGMKLGMNNMWGPFEIAENADLAELTQFLDRLAEKYGKELFRAHKWIRDGTLMERVNSS